MSTEALPPAPKPCESCPYRKDVPSGIWQESEYNKLVQYDLPTFHQPTGVFMCHQGNDRLCAGWCQTHNMANTLAIRVSRLLGVLSSKTFHEVLDYQTSVPCFASGAEAAAHGRKDIKRPKAEARKLVTKLAPRLAKRRQGHA